MYSAVGADIDVKCDLILNFMDALACTNVNEDNVIVDVV